MEPKLYHIIIVHAAGTVTDYEHCTSPNLPPVKGTFNFQFAQDGKARFLALARGDTLIAEEEG